MIEYHPEHEVVTMSLVDLEHAGFNYVEYVAELSAAGVTEQDAKMPVAILVEFHSGAVPPSSDEGISMYRAAARKYATLFERVTGKMRD